ncbi:MAG: hypothetical protein JO033_10925 [Acidobacteriaceae bacterium]|nr:hypothetical protein [Acidobacteriaceae bacterium]MBV9499326.1 hypothetical protein [Acidobacteriaceae bacterium]
MRAALVASLIFLVCAADLSSKDKAAKVPFQQMVAGMRDAFNCGVVVEKYLHGSLAGKADEYHQLRQENNCDYVESVLNTLPEKADEH